MKTNFKYLFFLLCAASFISCSKTGVTKSVQDSSADNSSTTILRTSLVAWYTFNGDDLDHSLYGNNVNFNSATAAPGRDGIPNTAYYFDGKTSYMNVPNSKTLNPGHGITLAALVKPTGFYKGQCHGNRIVMKGYRDQSNGVYFLGYDDALYYNYQGCNAPVMEEYENFNCAYGNNQYRSVGGVNTSDYIKKNRWYTVVLTVDTNKVAKLYVNGELKTTSANVNADFTANTDDLQIGRTLNVDYHYWFHGLIDEIRIYNRAYDPPAVEKISNDVGR